MNGTKEAILAVLCAFCVHLCTGCRTWTDGKPPDSGVWARRITFEMAAKPTVEAIAEIETLANQTQGDRVHVYVHGLTPKQLGEVTFSARSITVASALDAVSRVTGSSLRYRDNVAEVVPMGHEVGTPDNADKALAHLKPNATIPLAEAVAIAETRVDRLSNVGGFAGAAIAPTRFLEMSVVLIAGSHPTNFARLLHSTNAVVRAMGAVCISQTDTNAFAGVVRKLKDDKSKLSVYTDTCQPSEMTLGELLNNLQQDPNYLGHQDDYHDFQRFRKQVENGKVPVWALEIQWPWQWP